jgi:bifunctional non-homologous end joining protein LigD
LLICAHKFNGLRYGAISALGKKVAIVAAKDLQARLKPLIRKTQPYAKKIAHRGKSAEGKVRHPFFKGLREDL